MITREVIAQKILAIQKGEITESALVNGAEDAFIELTDSDADVRDEATLLEILGYIGAGDTPGFPLTWSTPTDFLDQLGIKVRVIAEGQANAMS